MADSHANMFHFYHVSLKRIVESIFESDEFRYLPKRLNKLNREANEHTEPENTFRR